MSSSVKPYIPLCSIGFPFDSHVSWYYIDMSKKTSTNTILSSLAKRVAASRAATQRAQVRVTKAKASAKTDAVAIEALLAEEGLAPLHDTSVGENRYGNDEPLFVDEASNPAPGVTPPVDARDQVKQDADEGRDMRLDFTDEMHSCDERWSNYVGMLQVIGDAGRSAWPTWKAVEEELRSEKLAIFGGSPAWDKVLKVWRRGNVIAKATDRRLSVNAGQGRALKAHALDTAGYACKACEALDETELCYDHQALRDQTVKHAEYLTRRAEQALKQAPVRAFTDLSDEEKPLPGKRSTGVAVSKRRVLIGPRQQ
jgi:hypothetical protein